MKGVGEVVIEFTNIIVVHPPLLLMDKTALSANTCSERDSIC
jgi:hypothetical protein